MRTRTKVILGVCGLEAVAALIWLIWWETNEADQLHPGLTSVQLGLASADRVADILETEFREQKLRVKTRLFR